MSIRLVLADDHPLIIDGLKSLLSRDPDFEIVASCANGNDVINAVLEHKPDILVLDIRMPGKGGIAVLKEIQALEINVKVVLLTGELTDKDATRSIRLGVSGIVLKDMAPQLLVGCLRKVYSGGNWLERHSFSKAMENILLRQEALEGAGNHLTGREILLTGLVAEGLRNREIAEKLNISEETVKRHLYNIYQKLNVKNRPQLIRYAHDKHLI